MNLWKASPKKEVFMLTQEGSWVLVYSHRQQHQWEKSQKEKDNTQSPMKLKTCYRGWWWWWWFDIWKWKEKCFGNDGHKFLLSFVREWYWLMHVTQIKLV
jgi:hypothetical protein